MIELRHISKRFAAARGPVVALDDVTLTIEEGRIHGLIGSSGAGKSTLLRCINLLERPDSGEVLVDGTDMLGLGRRALSAQRRGIGMIFQQFNLLDSKTVFDNVAMPMRLAGVADAEIKRRVEELLGFVELSDKASTYPPALSGGQKQRVGIARALANNPRILLCDEATSALDPETTESILALLKRVNSELGLTIVLVTHEMQVIARTCHRVAVMSHGRIVEEGPVLDVFADPREPITRRFVRTIIDDRIPDSLVDGIRTTQGHHEVWRLTAAGTDSGTSVLGEVNKHLDVATRLLYASMHEIDGAVLGVLVVQALGSPDELARARARVADAGVRLSQLDPHQLDRANEEGTAA
ncbi:MAG: ATP-binding cassette domain-containing protein [Propionibacteriaceae bacterium]|nr:ATP-binding cassette domain-containing protein [Propionibacteriaceae bacterium]